MPALSFPALLRALAVWLLIIAAESAQGALRRALAGPEADAAVRALAILVSVAMIFAITWGLRRWMALRSDGAALAVGALWAGLTLGFELGLGWLLGLSPTRILADYDLARGGLMPLGLLAMALTPLLVRRLAPPA